MKKQLLYGAALTLGAAASLTTGVFAEEQCDYFEVNGEASSICQLSEIVANELKEGANTIKFLKDFEGNGVIIDKKDVTIDFDGHTFTASGTLAGSTGTKNQAFQLLKGSTVTLKNGTVTSDSEAAKFFVQNYADTTLDNMILDATDTTVGYVVSNNNGSLTVKGDTNIIAKEGGVAFDMYYWPKGNYGNISVLFGEDYTGQVKGAIEYERDNTETHADDWQSLVELVIKNGKFDVDFNGKIEGANIAISGGSFTGDPSPYVADGYYTDHVAEDVNIVKKIDSNVPDGVKVGMISESGEAINKDNLAGMLGQLEGTDLEDLNITKVVDITLCQVNDKGCTPRHDFDRSFRFAVDAEFPELAEGYTRKYYVVRYHMPTTDDELVVDSWEVPYEDGKIVIESNLFSQFAIGYIDTETPKAPKAPDTGANQILSNPATASVVASAATGSVLALVLLALKRKFSRR